MSKNKDNLFDMDWIVNSSGYEIKQEELPKNFPNSRTEYIAKLTQKTKIFPKGENWREYNPFLDYLGIAREFSNLAINPNGEIDHDMAIKFANKYGLLGLGLSNGKQGEDIKEWTNLVEIFFDIFLFIDSFSTDAACNLFNEYGPDPRLLMRIAPADRKKKRSLEIKPTTLYGAMWIMVADELSRGAQLQECEALGCDVWFTKRSNKRFCSDRCKMAWHRQNKDI